MEFEELKELVQANAQTIDSLAFELRSVTLALSEVTQLQKQAIEERAELRKATIGIAKLVTFLENDCTAMNRQLDRIEDKLDSFLNRKEK